MSKYNNHKITNSFGEFASEQEWYRFTFLNEKQKNGEITNLKRQVVFTLLPAQYKVITKQLKTKVKEVQKEVEQACTYIADFTYERNGELVVEDVKGESESYFRGKKFSTQTDVFRLKKKMLFYFFGIEIQIVTSPTQWDKTN